MKKKIIQASLVLTLLCFSFYYTDKAVDLVKKNDPIMKEIQNVSKKYRVEAVNATTKDNQLTPGYNGKQINIEESFAKMKQYGKFNDSLLVFEEVKPTVTIDKTYDKYVISGNEIKNSVSLVFKVQKDDDISKILNTLLEKNVQATFFIDGIWLENNEELVYSMIEDLHQIEILSYDGIFDEGKMKLSSNKLKEMTKINSSYCYTEQENKVLLEACSKEKKHTIQPTILAGNYPYSTISTKIAAGSIISFNVNKASVKELGPILNYMKQKGYKTETLTSLLGENREIEK